MTDPRELVERLRDTSHGVRLIREAADVLDTLTGERDRLREVLIWLDSTLYSHIAETGSPMHWIKDESGVWHKDPGAEICLKVLRALQGVARAALIEGDET